MLQKRVFSGIQPSGNLHIGNYIGAIKQWVAIQQDHDCFFCIVDLHAITVPQDPKILSEKIKELTALYIACGIDPKKSVIFVQSDNLDHPALAWILDCISSMGQLSRMTQYKTKSGKTKGQSSVGLFNYPVLMAADILLYQTDEVPVGEDQKQHVELARDLAEKFNSRFGEIFKVPEVKMFKIGARIMSLRDPSSKMSKSDKDAGGTIDLLDSAKDIVKKIKSATTDSGKEILFRPDKEAISNLLTIYSHFSGTEIKKLEQKYQGKDYKKFKEGLADVVTEGLEPIRKEYRRIRSDETYLSKVLKDGLRKAEEISGKTLEEVYKAVGLG
ncbi:MAG: tryptophan--tRNA ligase [Patescibacteria group bacterium]|nr:tryptophan--tRNA ligase [Patescibacteria group bacterium]